MAKFSGILSSVFSGCRGRVVTNNGVSDRCVYALRALYVQLCTRPHIHELAPPCNSSIPAISSRLRDSGCRINGKEATKLWSATPFHRGCSLQIEVTCWVHLHMVYLEHSVVNHSGYFRSFLFDHKDGNITHHHLTIRCSIIYNVLHETYKAKICCVIYEWIK